MSKQNRIASIALALLLCSSVPLQAKDLISDVSLRVDEMHEMYRDYNEIDNFYDSIVHARRKISEALTVIMFLHFQPETPDKVHIASGTVEDLAFVVSNLDFQSQELSKMGLAGPLKKYADTVNKMFELTAKDFESYQEIRGHLERLGSDQTLWEKLQDLVSKREKFEEEYDKLNEQVLIEQEVLIKHHAELAKAVKVDLNKLKDKPE